MESNLGRRCSDTSFLSTRSKIGTGYVGLQGRDEQSYHDAEEGPNHHQLFVHLVHGNISHQAGLQHSAAIVDRRKFGQERERGPRDARPVGESELELLQEHEQGRCPGEREIHAELQAVERLGQVGPIGDQGVVLQAGREHRFRQVEGVVGQVRPGGGEATLPSTSPPASTSIERETTAAASALHHDHASWASSFHGFGLGREGEDRRGTPLSSSGCRRARNQLSRQRAGRQG